MENNKHSREKMESNVTVGPDTSEISSSSSETAASEKQDEKSTRKKRKKGFRKREEEQRKKNLGLPYVNRKGTLKSGQEFRPALQCCRRTCFESCPPEQQTLINSNYQQKSPRLRKQVLCERITIKKCEVHRKERGTKGGKPYSREKTVVYSTRAASQNVVVCKKFFANLYGVTNNQIDLLVKKVDSTEDGFIEADLRGKHTPSNKLVEERKQIKEFIEKYPRHESHYARRDNPDKIFLPSHLNVAIMHKEYQEERKKNGFEKSASYDVFRDVFHQTGYSFKQPYIDTCRKCDEFKTLKRSANTENEKERLNQLLDDHVQEANEAYERKRLDKGVARNDATKRVLVFDLQQVLPAPFLSTNIVYYKRLLSVYNLTVRDCTSTESSSCFMWYEVIGGRGSDQIASCIYKKIMSLPDTVKHITTYSDTCGGQNRNINVAAMFLYTINNKPSVDIIDQKFLLPGHTRLECDSDHARIERSKKYATDSKIMIPRDWYQFVKSLRGKQKFTVVQMNQEDFFAFSDLLSKSLVRRTTDTNGEKVSWLKIKWLRFTKEFGVVEFKYTLDDQAPFKVLDLRRRSRLSRVTGVNLLSLSYNQPIGINPKKKEDLLSMLDLIDKDCHQFFKDLPVSGKSKEFDELQDMVNSDEEEEDC